MLKFRLERATLRCLLSAIGFCLLWSAPVAQGPRDIVIAHVTRITDGDTFTALIDQQSQKIRIEGIDAPELGQPFGRTARNRLSDLTSGRTVRLEMRGTDRYDRLLARVTIDGRDIGRLLVLEGLAWQYERGPQADELRRVEIDARTARRGLWADPEPVPPWVFRRGRSAGAASATPPESGPYHGNVQTHVYHAPDCRDYNCKNCTAVFQTAKDAQLAGYRQHGTCVR